MKLMQTIKNEKGFALVLALVVMAAMTAIGVAAVTSSTTDLMIAKNEKEAKMAFYLAEAGIEEAIARLSLDEDDSWYIGETYSTAGSERDLRWDAFNVGVSLDHAAGGPKTFSSTDLENDATANVDFSALGGTYAVTVDYAYESNSGGTWCRGAVCDVTDEVVIFCYDFIGGNTPSDCDTGFPVYEVVSTGTTNGGTSARILTYVSAAALNLLPPGDTILFTEGEIYVGGDINGKVASWSDYIGDVEVEGCDTDCEDLSESVTDGPGTWTPPYDYDSTADDNEGAMIDYLGMSIESLISYADVSDEHSSNNSKTISASDYASDGGFGTMCDTDDTGAGGPDYDSHICDNKPQIIVIDNYDEANSESHGAIKTVGNETGRGLLIITGDLDIGGTFTWEGMIFVMGQLKVTGTATVYGTLMIEGDGDIENNPDNAKDVYVNGSLSVYGSRPVASSVAIGMSVPKMLRWTRL